MSHSKDSFQSAATLDVAGNSYSLFNLPKAYQNGLGDLSRLPYSLKILLENLLRFEDGQTIQKDDLSAFASWLENGKVKKEIAYHPARVLMQDFTGVPAVVDLATMRDAIADAGGDPKKINPLTPVDLVIDHSVQVDHYASGDAFEKNVAIEMQRNRERYEFLRWGQGSFENFRVVPPGTGICHQVNLENLAQVVWQNQIDGKTWAYPDTLVGTDSHTTMINGLAVLGWGVGGIEAEAAMLGQAISMMIPEVIGFELKGQMPEGSTATDLVLTVTQMLRQKGVVGKFVEFYGEGLDHLPLADRATLANMAPEYGATCGFFPIDQKTLDYLKITGRSQTTQKLVEAYAKEQGLWRQNQAPIFTDSLQLDLATIQPSLAGPKRPQDRVNLVDLKQNFSTTLNDFQKQNSIINLDSKPQVKGSDYDLTHGDVVIAAITSCTNTSNPSVMLAAGLVAKKANELGLKVKPWVKTSLAPGSQVVSDYLQKAGLNKHLDGLGFQLVGYGCTTCIGNSGPLKPEITEAIVGNNLVVCSVLSGNRNFEGRVSPHCKANYLASPPLVVAYALSGTTKFDWQKDSLGKTANGQKIFLKDIWPTREEVADLVAQNVDSDMFENRYANVFEGPKEWQEIPASSGLTYNWDAGSTYIQKPPFFEDLGDEQSIQPIQKAQILALLGDSVTTDHISPAGVIKADSPAGLYLTEKGVNPADFNSYGSRRGNHEVMMRGTFANIRIRNEMTPEIEGGFTKLLPEEKTVAIYDAAMEYQKRGQSLVVVAGKEYGTGSSRDWAAKGTRLLGVKAVIAESFERIHRSNLIGMGVLPLQFQNSDSRKSLNLSGRELLSIPGLGDDLKPGANLDLIIDYADGNQKKVKLLSRIDTLDEINYYKNGGILHYVLRKLK